MERHSRAAITSAEIGKLNHLLAAALLDSAIRERLVQGRDPALLVEFELSDETRSWLFDAQASTLSELAQAIYRRADPHPIGR